MYLIAASEVGEIAVDKLGKSPTAQKSVQVLDAWLDNKLKELTPTPNKEAP